MLSPQQVIPFLSSEDDEVRSLAQTYLHTAHDPSPATCEDVWAAIDKLGIQRGSSLIELLNVLPQTAETVHRTIQACRQSKENQVKNSLEAALMEISIEVLVAHQTELLNSELSSDILEHFEERLKLRGKPLDELWEELLRLCDADHDEDDIISEINQISRLIEAIGGHPEAAGRTMELLAATSEGNMREIAAADILSALRHRPAAALLLEKLTIEDAYFIHESVEDALPRMADDELVAQIESFHRAHPGSVQFITSAILGKIKLPSSESALLRLIEGDRKAPHFSVLADSLLALCSAAAIPALHKTAQVGGAILSFIDLRGMLAAVSSMTDTPFPEAELWRAEGAEKRRKSALRLQQMDDFMAMSGARGTGSVFEPEAPEGDYDPIAAPVTIRREEPKVGRNDPCPCGSGKKYKKCCLK